MQLRHLACALALAFPLVSFAAPVSGIDTSNFDSTVRIQDNLYQAVNGGWEKKTEIPSYLPSWGAFHELDELSQNRVRDIIESAAQNKDDPIARKIADYYASFMDENHVDELGIKPIQPLLDNIDHIDSHTALIDAIAHLQGSGINLPLDVSVYLDAKDSSHYLLQISQGSLGLPDRDYYLQKDARYAKARKDYVNYLTALFELDGIKAKPAARRAAAVYALEAKLAKVQWNQTDSNDSEKTYNKVDLAGLKKLAGHIDWDTFLKSAGAGQAANANVNQPSYLTALDQLLASAPLDVWRDYLRVRTLDGYASLLSKPFVSARFDFYGRSLAGTTEQRPRWKRGVSTVQDGLGEAVGKLYVAKYFPPEAKARMEVLVANLMKAYAQSIDKLGWMSPATKAAAQDKLAHYGLKIGYPNKWRDYSGLEIKADDLVGNYVRSSQFNYQYSMSHLGQPVDRDEWDMTPQTVNAYYEPTRNEIVFPAAILQAPFFNADADDAVNYGGIGAVIGHEISHGFDNNGRKFNGQGNMHDWWQTADAKAFDGLTNRLVAQYSKYTPIAGRFVNGKLTLGENIADLSGLQIAYKAYQLSLEGKEAPVMDGFTGDQRFFIGFAQIWRTKTRDEFALQLLSTDPHSPGRFRPVGAAVNCDAFDTAFDVKPGDGMYKSEKERIHIW